jgi:CRP-like cAMP-binding protein
MNVPEHGTVRILSLGPGDMVGWSAAVLELGEMTASAAAIEDTEVVALPADQLLRDCKRNPALGYEMMRRMAQQLARRLLATRLQLLELVSAQRAESTSRCSSIGLPRSAAIEKPLTSKE